MHLQGRRHGLSISIGLVVGILALMLALLFVFPVIGGFTDRIGQIAPEIGFGGDAYTYSTTLFPRGETEGGVHFQVNDVEFKNEIRIEVNVENEMASQANFRIRIENEPSRSGEVWFPGPNRWKTVESKDRWKIQRSTNRNPTVSRANYDGGYNVSLFMEGQGVIGFYNATDADIKDVE